LTDLAEKWSNGLNSEVGFWQNWIQTQGADWPDDYRARLDPKHPLKPEVENAIRPTGSREIDVLDVGAGPITCIGYVSEKFDLRITATDPLAEAYSVLLKEAGVVPPITTQKCFAENLLQHFGSRRFHVCFSRNALDHSIDPRSALLAMIQLLHPNGLMYVRVYKNEGASGGYEGLHSWNFDKDENNNFILWREGEKYNISEDIAPYGEWRLAEHKRELIFVAYRKAS
jgi:SAM-dependent methyltransferase